MGATIVTTRGNLLLWIVVTQYYNNDENEPTEGYPYAIWAETKDDAIEQVKTILVNEEIETEDQVNIKYPSEPPIPRGFTDDYDDDNNRILIPITWETISYEHNGEQGAVISEPRLFTELLKEAK